MQKSADQWIEWGKQRKRQVYFYEERVFDLTTFCMVHPGGKKALTNYAYKDITKLFFNVYPHTPQSLHMLDKYKVGTNTSFQKQSAIYENSPKKLSVKSSSQKRKVYFNKSIQYSDQKKENLYKKSQFYQGQEQKCSQQTAIPQRISKSSKAQMQNTDKSQLIITNKTLSKKNSQAKSIGSSNQIVWDDIGDIQDCEQPKVNIKIPIFHAKHLNQI